MQMRCFRLFYRLSRRISSATGSQYGASFASVTGRSDDCIEDELRTGVYEITSGALQFYKITGTSCEEKWSQTSEIYFQCSEGGAAANAGTNTVPVGSMD